MSTEPDQRYIIKRVDGFVRVCDTLDNDAPIDNSANGLEALLNALNTAGQPARMERIHDLNQMGGLCEENANLKAEVEHLQSELKMEKENEDRLVREWQRANNEVYGLQSQVAALIDDQTRLKAEVERLMEVNQQLQARCNFLEDKPSYE